jgi:hypothetical protein
MPVCSMGIPIVRSSEMNATLTMRVTLIQDRLALIVVPRALAATQTISETRGTTRQLESVVKAALNAAVGATVVLEGIATDTQMDSITTTDTPIAINHTNKVLLRILIQSLHPPIKVLSHRISNPANITIRNSSQGVTEVGPGRSRYPILPFTMAMAKGWLAGPNSCRPFKHR